MCQSIHPVEETNSTPVLTGPAFPMEVFVPSDMEDDPDLPNASYPDMPDDPKDAEAEIPDTPVAVHNSDQELQDVVHSSQAYHTLAQKHEFELLQIIYSIGAPNGSLQLIMSWAQAASTNIYDFQPMPKQYEHQLHHFE
jgi:hypothetical protein